MPNFSTNENEAVVSIDLIDFYDIYKELRSLVGYSPQGRKESDTTERLHFHFSLSCIGDGHGSPLQCSCLENPRDGGAWWAAVYGVAQSWTRLKRLSSSSIPLGLCTIAPLHSRLLRGTEVVSVSWLLWIVLP